MRFLSFLLLSLMFLSSSQDAYAGKKRRKRRAAAAEAARAGDCSVLKKKSYRRTCNRFLRKMLRREGKLTAKAQEVILAQESCSTLKGKDKRTCKRYARIGSRVVAASTHAEGGACAGKKGKAARQCIRTEKRDLKGKYGVYSFIGSKKANKESEKNWQNYYKLKRELDRLIDQNIITKEEYDKRMEMIVSKRKKESFKIGGAKTSRAIKAGVVVGSLGASGAILGAKAAAVKLGKSLAVRSTTKKVPFAKSKSSSRMPASSKVIPVVQKAAPIAVKKPVLAKKMLIKKPNVIAVQSPRSVSPAAKPIPVVNQGSVQKTTPTPRSSLSGLTIKRSPVTKSLPRSISPMSLTANQR